MKRVLFLCSHPHSGSSDLFDALSLHPRIQGFNLGRNMSYSCADQFVGLTHREHKDGTRASVYMDHLLYNHQLTVKAAYGNCRFIYFVREPEAVLGGLVADGIREKFASRSYTFRLRRLCEMASRTPGAVLLTWNDFKLGRGAELVEEYLELKGLPNFCGNELRTESKVSLPVLEEAQKSYDKYLYFLKSQKLRHYD